MRVFYFLGGIVSLNSSVVNFMFIAHLKSY